MNTNTFTRGMNQDILPKIQEEGTYRFALNGVLESEEGKIPAVSNELSNSLCQLHSTSKILIGSALTDTDQTILFYYDPSGDHEIGLYNPTTCAYTQIVHGACLNFSDKYPVNAIVKIRNGCDRVVYFTDRYNKYRVLNIDNLEGLVQEESGELLCSKILYTKEYFRPCVEIYRGTQDSGIEDSMGGSLEVGVYYFAVRFLDAEYNTTDWTLVTRGVAVGDEATSNLFNTSLVNSYDGGSNVETSPLFVPKTDKAISLLITGDIDTFPYYQVAVIKRTSDSGALSGIDILKPKAFQGFPFGGQIRVPFTYTGTPSAVEREGTLEEILVNRQPIDVIEAHAVKENTLFLAGTTYDYRDYSKYQQYASKVKVGWEKIPTLSSIQDTPRLPNYYLLEGSFMEDEIYALAIVYVFSNGRISPAFHIPGRAPDTTVTSDAFNPLIGSFGIPSAGGSSWDTGSANYGDIFPELGTQNRWKLTSTAYSFTSFNQMEGMMGYYECDEETYPQIATCEDLPDGYWGRDYDGNLLEANVTKIRHHRMPGAEFKDDLADNNRTGIRFSNVEYPPDQDIVGHYFVYADRTHNKTIQAKGVFIPLITYVFDTEDLQPKTYTVPVVGGTALSKANFLFICAENLLTEKFTPGDYVKIEKVLRDMNYEAGGLGDIQASNTNSIITDPPTGGNISSTNNTTIRYFERYRDPDVSEILAGIDAALKIDKSYVGALVGTEAYEPFTQLELVNQSVNHSYHFLHLSRAVAATITNEGGNWEGKAYFGAIRKFSKVFEDLFSLTYKRMSNCIDMASSLDDEFVHYGGDTAINRVSFVEFDFVQNGIPPASITSETNAVYFSFPSQDSWVNFEFRHGSSSEAKYEYFKYRNGLIAADHRLFSNYLDRKKYEVEESILQMYPETYNYNNSYSFLDGIDVYYPLPYAYQYCNTCVDNHPYRIYSAQKDTQETLEDKSRIVLPNDYQDLNGLSGPITDLFVNFDQLYVTTTNSTYVLPVNTQVFQTDTSEVFIGTGKTLSVPAKELKNTAYAFGGQQQFKSRTSTEYGTFFVDGLSKRPLLLSSNLEDLSLSGLRSFWQEHGGLKFLEQFMELTSEEYNVKATTAPTGVGYISTYDPRFKRIIVHKRDFKISPSWSFTYVPLATDIPLDDSYIPTKSLGYNGHSFYHCDASGNATKVDFNNGDFFENHSFTLSYSFLTKHWVSFHSYLSPYMFNTSKTFFSTYMDSFLDTFIYKHNNPLSHQFFYDAKAPFIIDFIYPQNILEQKTSSSIVLNSTAYAYDLGAQDKKVIPKTFTGLIAYNSNQTTGYQDLVEKTDAFTSDIDSSITLTKLTDRQWRINNLRDLAVDNKEPIWDSSWLSKLSAPYQYIDKVPYLANIDYNKSLFELSRLKDHYLGVRLFLKSSDDYKLVTDLASTTYQNKNR